MCNERKNDLASELFTADHQFHDPQVPAENGPAALRGVQAGDLDRIRGRMKSWCRCFGPGRSLRLVLGGDRLSGQYAAGGAGWRLPGWVGSESEASYRAE